MKVQFYFKTNNDYVLFVERATGQTLGSFQGLMGEADTRLSCSGKPVRLRRSLRGHVVLYFDAYEGASLVIGNESGIVNLTSNTLREALEIRSQFPQLLISANGQELEVVEMGHNIPATVVEIIGGTDFPRATPVTPASAPLLNMMGIHTGREVRQDKFVGVDSKQEKSA
jgi:hypothetical protein